MNFHDIELLATAGESATLEFKQTTGTIKSAFETVCAFLNTDGGVVLIGVTDNGKLVGQEVSDKTKREIGNELAKISPTANIKIKYIPLPNNTNHKIIAITTTVKKEKQPYAYSHKSYLRVESDTVPMPREHQQQIMMNNAPRGSAWEDMTSTSATIHDLDIEEILKTIQVGTTNGRIEADFATDHPWTALEHLDLIENKKISNAAIVLFAKNPEKWFPQCVLKLARFRGTNKDEFIDEKRVTGNAFKKLHDVLNFANLYLPVSGTFSKNSIERIDTPLFPILALREAIANAICHRDYCFRGGSISFGIFDDRIEIWNYGLLPNGVTIEKLKHLNKSVPRNPKIANVFYYHKIVETWGRGVSKILKLCTDAGHPEPIYSQVAGGTLLTLTSKQEIAQTAINELVAPNLTKRQEIIIGVLSKFKILSVAQLQEKLNDIPERTLRLELNRLQEAGIVKAEGETNKRKWHLLD